MKDDSDPFAININRKEREKREEAAKLMVKEENKTLKVVAKIKKKVIFYLLYINFIRLNLSYLKTI